MLVTRLGAVAAVGTAIVLGASSALAAGGWTNVPVPPTGHNAFLVGVTTTSDSNAWAVGSTDGQVNTVGAKPLIVHWDGTAWSQVTAPPTPGFNTASLAAVSASSAADAWAVGRSA